MPAHAWDDYQIIQWQSRNEPVYAALKRLGVTAAMVMANRDGTGTPVEKQFAPMQAAGLSWYVENIATDFYSAYHRWFPNREVNWRFVEAQQRFQQNPDDETVFWRDPSFADPAWQQRIRDRLIATVHEQSRYHPLYYSLGDETGIADLTAFFDFDLSPGSLAGMRDWLRQGYGSLDALNAEWGTDFARWEDVRPETTRQAMRRADDNFAAWADFKAWMDVAFARALRMGTDAVHEADPSALAAIEGVQIPGWGGYDYSLLVDAVDVMEVHDLPLAHSLNPRLVTLTTSFGSRPQDIHAIWRDLLAGSRGLILWDSENAIVRDDATTGEQGLAYAETFAEIRGGIGAMLIASEPHVDPVAILYSPASFRTQWMLEQKPKGDAWMTQEVGDGTGKQCGARRDVGVPARDHASRPAAGVCVVACRSAKAWLQNADPAARDCPVAGRRARDPRVCRRRRNGDRRCAARRVRRAQPAPAATAARCRHVEDDRAQRAECIVPRRDARRADRGAEWRCHQPHLAARQ